MRHSIAVSPAEMQALWKEVSSSSSSGQHSLAAAAASSTADEERPVNGSTRPDLDPKLSNAATLNGNGSLGESGQHYS